MNKTAPIPILGTAMWGWTTPRERCFEMLSHFYDAGWREVDAATNYPINKQAEDFRLAEQILEEWINAHGISDLKVMMKVGSLNNMRTPDHNLTKSFLLIMLNEYQQRLGSNLDTFMVHWDNRETENEIRETFEAFEEALDQGLRPGLSGIRHPEVYYKINQEYQYSFRIQIKHNLLHSDYERYRLFHESGQFITYGINAGGLKLSPELYEPNSSLAARGGNIDEVPPIVQSLNKILAESNLSSDRPALSSMNHFGMIYAYYSPGVTGILLGTSKIEQLKNSLAFHQQIGEFGYEAVYQKLLTVI